MLQAYESDYAVNMDVEGTAFLIWEYTSGYPFLVSRICKLIDEKVIGSEPFETRQKAWTAAGVVEACTRNQERTDLIIDYCGSQYIVEMKIWRGNAYHERGEKQLTEYLEHYHLKKGYMLSFHFNKNKEIGVRRIELGDKVLIEAVV